MMDDLRFLDPEALVNRAAFNARFEQLNNAVFNNGGTLEDILGNAVGVQIETGSYVGTGTYGSSNPNTLSFSFSPKFGVVHRKSASDSEYAYILFINGVVASQTLAGSKENTTNNTWLENGIKWYAAFDYAQMNVSGVEYYYAFFG